jgi:hypothetical protein
MSKLEDISRVIVEALFKKGGVRVLVICVNNAARNQLMNDVILTLAHWYPLSNLNMSRTTGTIESEYMNGRVIFQTKDSLSNGTLLGLRVNNIILTTPVLLDDLQKIFPILRDVDGAPLSITWAEF